LVEQCQGHETGDDKPEIVNCVCFATTMNAAPDLPSGRPGPPDRPPVWLHAAGLLACLGTLAAEAWFLSGDLGFPLDDSWIHLQFARNLAAGHGLSYNPGELVTGSTAPLWTALLSLFFLLPGSVVVWTKLLGIALHLAGVDAVWRLARELDLSRPLASLAAGLTLATSWLVWSALSGMEIPLFILLSTWGLVLHSRERARPGRPEGAPLSFAVLAVAVLARPEGLLLLALAFVDRCLVFDRENDEGELALRRPPVRVLLTGAALAACALLGPLLFYGWAGDSVLPTTYAAKGAGEPRRWLPSLPYLYNVLGVLFRSQPFMTLLAGAGVLTLLERLGTRRDRGLLPALWLAGLPLAYSVLAPAPTRLLGNFGRYHFPLLPVLIVLGVLGLARAAESLGPRVRAGRLRLPFGGLLAALILAATLWSLVSGTMFYVRNVANVQDSDVALARWLAPRLDPRAVLAVNDIGALKYFLPNRVVDLASIATPEIRREVQTEAATGVPWSTAMVHAIERRQPDYIAIFPAWIPGVARDPRFVPVHTVRLQDNITMGGDEIVVYATPWTRYPLRQAR
jgi:4-amino-4-deoxy-L-arabinose transferase-like glycosyltransferase